MAKAESVLEAAVRITDARYNGAARILAAIAEVDLPYHLRERLMERLRANGAI
ncbi:hypothetical protein [Cyanobium sp. WAJ14-Wanaka]|uniref:hypothetical protein n=1 Tax=Cyanobium sp. WAJ14-Wanaka TaxID=2823725 RepID=UPI0020CD26BB|nr:hypothetical protein [Cyanobium sp. WAJ14-Wanaka]MCP9776217.1 hypothetical protein [Cyanobium sp. WAJ14-Wanaka]